MRDDRVNIAFIAECIRKIESYTQCGKDNFMQTPMIQDAVVRNFEVIGEATKNLSADLRLSYPDVPWRKMAGFRDVLIHNYINVDLEIVWEIVEAELPPLQNDIETILSQLGEGV